MRTYLINCGMRRVTSWPLRECTCINAPPSRHKVHTIQQDNVTGRVWVRHWYDQLHLLRIIQNSWHPLRGLSHSVIILQKAQSHILTCVYSSEPGWQLVGSQNCRAKLVTSCWFVVKPLEHSFAAPISCFQNISHRNSCSSCCWCTGTPYRVCFECLHSLFQKSSSAILQWLRSILVYVACLCQWTG